MHPQHRTAIFLLLTFLSLFFCVSAEGPSHTVTHFYNLPSNLFFFDDTQSAIYHDYMEGNVYVSVDEGRSWSRATDIPNGEAAMVIQHPFDNRYAFVLTAGTTHYRSEDRGKTWRSFNLPLVPAPVPRPLSFHSDKSKYGYILYQGTDCERSGWGDVCHDETFYTKEAFGDVPLPLISESSRCQFAHSSADFKHEAHTDLIYCVAFDTSSTTGVHTLSSSRLFSTTDFFTNDVKIEDLGIGRNARGVIAFAIVSKFAVVALRDLTSHDGDLHLYVTVDTKNWAKAQFPHASTARLRENAYTIVESTTHSLGVDVKLQEQSTIGTLFVSNSNGTYFVQSLKDTNRNEWGYVDYESIYGVEGVGLANVVANAEVVEGRGADKKLRTVITFDDGSSWTSIRPPSTDIEGQPIKCDLNDVENCSLHFHSVTDPHNFGRIFSSPAPGLVMGVGSIGASLDRYEDSATFLSTNAGVDWKMVSKDAHKYEFGDLGSILVVINDEEGVSDLRYSTNLGKSWNSYDFGIKIRARALTTLPDSTSQKFILLGQMTRRDAGDQGRFVIIFLDFSPTRQRKCGEDDFENWYARTAKGKECLMGHKQWYKRRKVDADCYVGEIFQDPVEHEENCPCTEDDFECDYNYIRNGDECVPVGPERIPAGVCTGNPDQIYRGSSGWRRIPGNTCVGGLARDALVDKKCSQAQPEEGKVIHQTFEFQSQVVQHAYLKDSMTILVRLADYSMWQSSNEGYTWRQLYPEEKFLAFYLHSYSNDRAYLITNSKKFYYTTDTGRQWMALDGPSLPNTFQTPVLQFHPQSDRLIWTGDIGCSEGEENCHAESQYSTDNGRQWSFVETYVAKCAWAKDAELRVDPAQILCESYRDKAGSQRKFRNNNNALQLIGGTNYFASKRKMFDHVVGFTKFSEYLIVAEYLPQRGTLDLQVSLDGRSFATGRFPPNMQPETHAYTILESTTDSLFLHKTISEPPSPYWGNILKSNSNGTYFGLSIENVNRDERGLVDFEKMIGLDGIAVVNIVANPTEARITKRKSLQTRITHNDGGSWRPLTPPTLDSMQQKYECVTTNCALHIHGYTERPDPRATYSSPSVVGLMLAVGNVGEELAAYTESDTFLSRDAGFTWEEVHKDAHLWEFGDSGSILVMANDEGPTDHVLFSTNEGISWREYKFTNEKIRVRTIVTVSSDTSRRFILMGNYPRSSATVAVYLDFSALTSKLCVLNLDDPGHDDFELWSPSEERSERCLFGRQTVYHRRVRNATCVVGNQPKAKSRVVNNCACESSDFECEFNYVRNENDECVLVPGATALANDDSCNDGERNWYERTAYRKIPFSTCDGGPRPDRGTQHTCPGIYGHSTLFWLTVIMAPIAFTALIGYWYYRRSGYGQGFIRLPTDARSGYRQGTGVMDYLASIPWYIVGVASVAWESVSSFFESLNIDFSSRRGYRDVPVDEDAQILRFEDEEEEEEE